MTIRRKQPDEFEVTGPLMWRFLAAKGSYRIFLTVVVLSMHPIGRSILATFGFVFTDDRNAARVGEEALQTKQTLTTLVTDVKDLHLDVSSIKASNAILQEKVSDLDHTFQGFKIDFNKYRLDHQTDPVGAGPAR